MSSFTRCATRRSPNWASATRRSPRSNPSIVYTNCYGYGRHGPDRDLTAYDDTIQADCGLAAAQEMLTGEANYVGTIIADKVTGLTALYATMMALFHRERTGEGQEVEVSMFETMASFMLVEHANGAMFTPPLGAGGLSARGVAQPPPLPDHATARFPRWSTTTSSGPPSSAPCSRRGTTRASTRWSSGRKQIDTVYALLARNLPGAHDAGVAGPAALAGYSRRRRCAPSTSCSTIRI